MADGRSKVRRLADKIMRELEVEYVAETDLAHRRMRAAAEYLALAEKTRRTIGSDPKATRRAASQLERVAEAKLAALSPRRPAKRPLVETLAAGGRT
jgi:hypothetical protein